MNLEWMNCFVESSKHKSLSKASEHLNLTQPAVSKQIRKLEAALGVTLLERTPQGVELTEAGQLFLKRIQPVLHEINAIRADLQLFQHPSNITVGTFPSLASYYLPSKIVRLRKSGLELNITVLDTTEELLNSVQMGSIDMALVEMDSDVNGLFCREVFAEPYFAVLPQEHPLSEREYLLLKHLYEEPLILHPTSCKIRQTIIRVYGHRGVQAKISMEVSFGQSILGFVAAGAGVTIVPQIIAEHVADLPVVVLPIADFEEKRQIKLVTRSQKLLKTMYSHFTQ